MKSFVKSTVLFFAIFAAITLGACKPSVSSNAPESFTVTYKTDHGTAPTTITVEQDTVLTQAQLPALTCTGYVFLGWYDAETKAEAGKYKVTRDVTLSAKWNKVNDFELPLTFEFINAGNVTVSNPWSTLKYSKNGGSLVAYTEAITAQAGDKICLYAKEFENTPNGMWISCSEDCYIYGNIMSIVTLNEQTGEWNPYETTLRSGNFYQLFSGNTHIKNHRVVKLYLPATTLENFNYGFMFAGCTGLTEAPALPATTLAPSCYSFMFVGCTGLTEAPVLPATMLAPSCYYAMFSGCTGLKKVPDLKATTLAYGCYSAMFIGCEGLTKAPAIKAMTLADFCCQQMFSGCTSLKEVPDLLATTLAESCYYEMFYGCTNLEKAPALPATTLARACYKEMFYGCTSLTESPLLPAPSLVPACYNRMFYGCTKLNKVKCLVTGSFSNSYDYIDCWLTGVSSTGTFILQPPFIWPSVENNGIPSDWTFESYQ